MSDDHKQWYFIHNGRVFGPLPFHALREATYAGILSVEDEVWNSEGVRGKAGNVDGLPFDSSQATPTGEQQARQQAGALADPGRRAPGPPRPVKLGGPVAAPVPVAVPELPTPAEVLAPEAAPEPVTPMPSPVRPRPPSGKRPVLKLTQNRQDDADDSGSHDDVVTDAAVDTQDAVSSRPDPGSTAGSTPPLTGPQAEPEPEPTRSAASDVRSETRQAADHVVPPTGREAGPNAPRYQGSYTDWRAPLILVLALACVIFPGFWSGNIFYSCVGVLIVITIWSLRSSKRREARGGGQIALICSIAIMAIAIGRMVYTVFFGVDARDADNVRRAFEAYSQEHARVAGRRIGEYLAENYSGSRILIIVDRQRVDSRFETIRNGLIDSLDRRLKVAGVAKVDVSRDHLSAGMRTAKSNDEITVATFESPIRDYPDADIVVSFLPLPANHGKLLDRQKLWGRRVRFVLVTANVRGLQEAIPAGLVVAAVVGNPKPRSFQEDSAAPTDYKQLFDKHYVLLESSNIAQFVREYPALFDQ